MGHCVFAPNCCRLRSFLSVGLWSGPWLVSLIAICSLLSTGHTIALPVQTIASNVCSSPQDLPPPSRCAVALPLPRPFGHPLFVPSPRSLQYVLLYLVCLWTHALTTGPGNGQVSTWVPEELRGRGGGCWQRQDPGERGEEGEEWGRGWMKD